MGLLDNINDAVGQGMSSPLFALGSGLIAGAQPFANPGQQLQSAAANQQSLAMNRLQMQMLQRQLPMLMPILQQLGGLMGSPQGSGGASGSASAPAPQQGQPSGGLIGGPAPAPMIAATPQQLAAQSSAPPVASPSPPAGAAPGASGGMDPVNLARFGLLASVLPMTQPMGKAAMQAAQIALQTNPGLATTMAAAKSTLAQDQAMYNQAQQNGDQLGMQAARMKYLKDAGMVNVAAYNGAVTTMGGVTPADVGASTINPIQGVQTRNGVESPLPGAAATQQTLAGAKARGAAQGDVEEVTDSNGNRYYVSRSSLLGGGSAGSAGGTASGITPFQASVGPATEEVLKGKGEQAVETNKDYQSQAEAGQQMLAQIAQLKSAANDFAPGQFADSRIKGLQWMQSLGLITPEEQKRLGSAQEGTKIAIQLQAAATKQLGSREAAQIFQIMGKSLPNLTLSPDGLSKVSSYMAGIARYNMARAQVAQQHLDGNDANGVNDVRDNFIQNTNPTYYIVASAPPTIQKEMIASMGSKGRSFLENWQKAANAGWAPRPTQYANEP